MISIDRYMAFQYPLRYGHAKTTRHTVLKIAVVWVVSFCIAGPLFVLSMLDDQTTVHYKGCGPETQTFVISATVASFYVPLFIMTVMYALTVHALRRQLKEQRRMTVTQSRGATTRTGGGTSAAVATVVAAAAAEDYGGGGGGVLRRSRTPLISVSNGGNGSGVLLSDTDTSLVHHQLQQQQPALQQLSIGDGSQQQQQQQHAAAVHDVSMMMCEGRMMSSSSSPSPSGRTDNGLGGNGGSGGGGGCDQRTSGSFAGALAVVESDLGAAGGTTGTGTTSCNGGGIDGSARSLSVLGRQRVQVFKFHQHSSNASCMSSSSGIAQTYDCRQTPPTSSQPPAAIFKTVVAAAPDRGRRAVRVLGILFAVFVVFYLPFFAVYIINGTCTRCQPYISSRMITAFEWLQYSGSMLNPIVYHIFNPDFRRAFIKILRCRRS